MRKRPLHLLALGGLAAALAVRAAQHTPANQLPVGAMGPRPHSRRKDLSAASPRPGSR